MHAFLNAGTGQLINLGHALQSEELNFAMYLLFGFLTLTGLMPCGQIYSKIIRFLR